MFSKTFWAILIVFISLLGVSYYFQNRGVSKGQLPQYALRNSEVETAYRYVVDNSGKMEKLPCYCNCYKLGHRSVKDCFINKTGEERVVFNDHGANCGICYSIILDAKRLLSDNNSIKEVRSFVDDKYSQYGTPTKTPQL